jgi:hypothetical protein
MLGFGFLLFFVSGGDGDEIKYFFGQKSKRNDERHLN